MRPSPGPKGRLARPPLGWPVSKTISKWLTFEEAVLCVRAEKTAGRPLASAPGPQLYTSPSNWSKPDKRFRKSVEPLLRPSLGPKGRLARPHWAGRCLSYAYRYDEAVLCMIATNLEVWEAVLCVRVRAAQKTGWPGRLCWPVSSLLCEVRFVRRVWQGCDRNIGPLYQSSTINYTSLSTIVSRCQQRRGG